MSSSFLTAAIVSSMVTMLSHNDQTLESDMFVGRRPPAICAVIVERGRERERERERESCGFRLKARGLFLTSHPSLPSGVFFDSSRPRYAGRLSMAVSCV
ncbi:hypothetical protein LX36DRAFT_328190 [Colletotrichum falcatum]|nr:hypothetical protein LX36DRAFT_328190 [Colletotrichum falcatum]